MIVRPIAVVLAAALLFGAATPASKLLLAKLPPFQLAGLLYLGAAAAAVPWTLRTRTTRGAGSRGLAYLAGAIVFGGVLGPVLLLSGLRAAAASSVALWLNLELVATALLARAFFREHLGPFGWVGAAGAIAAAAMVSLPERGAGMGAALLVAAACACWGVDNNLTALIDGMTPATITFWKGLAAGTVNLSIGLAAEGFGASAATAAVALAVGAISYGASLSLYIAGAREIGATRAQTIFASGPFFGAALSLLVFGEPFGARHLAGAALLAASIALLNRSRHQHPHAHQAVAHVHEHRHDDGHHAHDHGGAPAELRHTHWHEHEPVEHTHPHWPDLHHRHEHEGEQS